MALLTEWVEQDDLGGGQYRNIINMRKIAYRQNGSLLRASQDWEDSGDGAMPHAVTRSPLRTRTANDGMRRIFPIVGDDSSYLEIGAPYIKISGVWTKVSLGTPARSGKTITWTRPQTITTITHGIHFVKLEIELRNGFVPEDSMIAFPVSITGLSRSGTEIRKNGVPVMQLRPFIAFDAANPDDIRPIAHSFTTLLGQPYLLLTLPSLTGMTRSVIDPTLSLQQDATAGLDTYISQIQTTRNFGVTITLQAGKTASSGRFRSLLKFDISSVPGSAIVSAATLTLRCSAELAATDYNVSVHRALTQWFEGISNSAIPGAGEDASTYLLCNANGSVAWAGGAGGGSGSDYAATATATTLITGTGVDFDWSVLADVSAWVAGSATNHGLWALGDEAANDSQKTFVSSDGATASQRPKLVVTYTLPAAGRSFFVAPFQPPFGSLFG